MKQAKKTVASVVLAAMTLSAFAFAGCDNAGTAQTPNVPNVDAVTEVPEVPKYDGTIVQAGGSYDLRSNIAFLSSDVATTSAGDYTSVSCELTATVTPADANQAVSWSVEWVNPSSSWATGKTVTDYVSLTTGDTSTAATVTCSAPFGEQVKIVCTSNENSSISAECVVDFLQSVKSVSLQFGDNLSVNLGGQTDVTWEVNSTGVGIGGTANVNLSTYDVYTIGDTYTWDIDLISPYYFEAGRENKSALSSKTWGNSNTDEDDPAYEDDYLIINSTFWATLGREGELDCFVKRQEDITSLTFDSAFLKTTFLSGLGTGLTSLVNIYQRDSGMIMGYYNNVEEGSLYTLRLTLKGATSGTTAEYLSLINLTAFTNAATVQSISLSSSSIKY